MREKASLTTQTHTHTFLNESKVKKKAVNLVMEQSTLWSAVT